MKDMVTSAAARNSSLLSLHSSLKIYTAKLVKIFDTTKYFVNYFQNILIENGAGSSLPWKRNLQGSKITFPALRAGWGRLFGYSLIHFGHLCFSF
jgi:hypothetical protein